VKFKDQMFRKFLDSFVGFTRLKAQKMHVFLCSQILISQADQYCGHKNVTKAILHITTESSYKITKYRIKAMP